MTLEEQIKWLEGMTTNSSKESKAKSSILSTLNNLLVVRNGILSGAGETDPLIDAFIASCDLPQEPAECGS